MIQSLLMSTHSNPTDSSLRLCHILESLGLNIFIDSLWRNHLSPGLSFIFSWHYYSSLNLMEDLLFAVCFGRSPSNLLVLFLTYCRSQSRHEPTFLLWRSVCFICTAFYRYHWSIVKTWGFSSFRQRKDRVLLFFRFITPSSYLINSWRLFLINFVNFCVSLFTLKHSFDDFMLGSLLWLPLRSHGN